jgi:hypothetical protein
MVRASSKAWSFSLTIKNISWRAFSESDQTQSHFDDVDGVSNQHRKRVPQKHEYPSRKDAAGTFRTTYPGALRS